MTPGEWAQALLAAVGGLVAVYIIWSQIVAWRTAQTRQRQAEDMVRNGADPHEAAKAVKMPLAQRAVFVAVMHLVSREELQRRAAADAAASPVPPAVYVLELASGERLIVHGASTLEQAQQRAQVHPANVVRHYPQSDVC
jgi:hypothetical protein